MKLVHLFFGDKPDVKWQLVSQMGIRYAFAKLAPELTGKKPITDFETLKAQMTAETEKLLKAREDELVGF